MWRLGYFGFSYLPIYLITQERDTHNLLLSYWFVDLFPKENQNMLLSATCPVIFLHMDRWKVVHLLPSLRTESYL